MAKKIHATYSLIWKRKSGIATIPIQLATSVKPIYFSDSLVCDRCNEDTLKQQYVCSNCGCVYSSIGFIKKRKNKRHNIIYDIEEKRNYLMSELDRIIEVKDEINLSDALLNYGELFNAFNPLEVFNNDTDIGKEAIRQIYNFLKEKSLSLLVEANYRGNNFLSLIIPANTGKLILIPLKDENLLKEPYNISFLDKEYKKSGFTSIKKQKEDEFYYAKINGFKLEIKKIKEQPKLIISEDFLSGD